jgi:geranylgeranyl pyrophosphate synthase
VLDTVRQLALQHAASARAALRSLPPTEYREHLLDLIDQLVERPS